MKKGIWLIVFAVCYLNLQGAHAALHDNGDGTITDGSKVWLKNANCFGAQSWDSAMKLTAELQSGKCGLTDKSKAGQWRLPSISELDARWKSHAGFINFQSLGIYWTNEVGELNSKSHFVFRMTSDRPDLFPNSNGGVYVWPVREK